MPIGTRDASANGKTAAGGLLIEALMDLGRPSQAQRVLAPLLLAGCASAAPPPPPAPPIAGPPAAPPTEVSAPAVSAPAPAPPEPPPPPPAGPVAHMAIEPPFRLDRRIFPKTKEAFLADLKDRTAWNTGGLGSLAAEPPPVPGHPAPKVIIDVVRASGALKGPAAQAVLRRGFWMKTVECFSLSAYKDQKLRGTAAITLTVSATGKVTGARVTHNGFHDDEVPRCLANQLRAFPLPKSKGKSTLALEFQIGHGDEPVPPPASTIGPGDGTLAPEEIKAVIEAARPALEECHREALPYAPELWGRLGIRFHVTEKGKTDEAFEVESQFPDERVKLCVLRAARKIGFPVPAGGDIRFIVSLRFWSDKSPVPSAPEVK